MIEQEANRIISSLTIREAEKQSYVWYKEARENIYSPDVVFVEDRLLQPGKINIFKYNPKYKDTLDYYDKHPVVISLGTIVKADRSKLELGINLNFIPTPYKWQLLDTIQKTYSGFFNRVKSEKSPRHADQQPRITYNYRAIRALLNRYGVGFALRTYIPSRKRDLYVVNYNNWLQAGLLSIEDFEKITYDKMVSEYRKYK